MAKSINALSEIVERLARERLLAAWGIASAQQAQALALLDALGCSARVLLDNKAQQENLQVIFKRLLWLKALLPQSSAQTFIYHAQQLCQLYYPDDNLDQILISAKNLKLNKKLLTANTLATREYGAMTALAIAVAAGAGNALEALGVPFTAIYNFSLILWNGVDTYECYAEKGQQAAQGEQHMANANLIAGGQMAIATSLVAIDDISAFIGPALIGLSAVASSALLGGSFALSYYFCWYIEACKVELSDQEIVLLEARLDEVELKIKDPKTKQDALPALKEERVVLQEHLLIAKARRQDLQNSANAFGTCAIAMTVTLVVAYVGLNFLTLGGINLVPVVIAIAIFATYLYRAHYTQSLSHSTIAQQSLLPPATKCSAISSTEALPTDKQPLLATEGTKQSLSFHLRLMAFLEKHTMVNEGKKQLVFFDVDFCQKVTFKGVDYFKSATSLVDYLQALQFKNPDKLEKLLLYLENNDKDGFKATLAEKQQCYSLSETFGQKIFNQLVADGAGSCGPLATPTGVQQINKEY